MQEIIIKWNHETEQLETSDDVVLRQGDRNLRIRLVSRPPSADAWQIDWEEQCPFARQCYGINDDVITYTDWRRDHGPFKFTVRLFDPDGVIVAKLDPGGGSDPPPPYDDWP